MNIPVDAHDRCWEEIVTYLAALFVHMCILVHTDGVLNGLR